MYDYRCEANGQTLEVRHCMSESITNWGELCEKAAIDPGETPRNAPVERLIPDNGAVCCGGQGHGHSHAHAHAGGGCCGGGGSCGCH